MRFKAFISYSHVADHRLAPTLQRSLERFTKPWYRARAIRVFRDVTNLAVSPQAWPEIQEALSNSEFLILLASPTAADSKWVKKEVEFWLENKSRESLLIVLTEGQLKWSDDENDYNWSVTTALPSTLARRPDEPPLTEPLHLDFSNLSGEQLEINNDAFLERVSSIAARLHGKSKDEIFGQHIREQRRTLRLALGVVFSLICILCVAIWQYQRAETNAENARTEARISNAREAAARADFLVDRSPAVAADLTLKGYAQLKGTEPPSELITSLWRVLGKSGGWPLTNGALDYSGAVSFGCEDRFLAHDIGKGGIHIWDLGNGFHAPSLAGKIKCNHNIISLLFLNDKLQITTKSGGLTANFSFHPPRVIPWRDSQIEFDDLFALHAPNQCLTVGGNQVVIRDDLGKILQEVDLGECEILKSEVTQNKKFFFVWTTTGLRRFNLDSLNDPAEIIPFKRKSVMRHSVSAHGDHVATSSAFKGIEVVDRHSDGTWHSRPFVEERLVSSLSWTTDGATLAAGSTEGLLLFLKSNPDKPQYFTDAHDGWVMNVSFIGSSQRLMTSGEDGTVRFWNTDAMTKPAVVIQAHEEQVHSLISVPESTNTFTASSDTSIVHWDTISDPEKIRARLNFMHSDLKSLALSQNGRWVFAGSDDGTTRIWNLSFPNPDSALAMPVTDSNGGGSQTVSVDNISGKIVTNNSDGTVFVVSSTGGEITNFRGHTSGYLDEVAFSLDGKWLVTQDFEEGVRAWSLENTKPHKRCPWDSISKAVDSNFSIVPDRIYLWSIEGVAAWNIVDSNGETLKWSEDPIIFPLANGMVEVAVPYDITGRKSRQLHIIPQDHSDVFLQLLDRFHDSPFQVDEQHDRIIVEPEPGRIEVWSYSNSEPVMQHTLTLKPGVLAGECLILNCVIGNGFLVLDDDQRLIYVYMACNSLWTQDVVPIESQEILTVSHVSHGQHVLVSFEDGPAEVWAYSDAKCGFNKKMILPRGSLVNDTILVAMEEDKRSCAVCDLTTETPTLKSLPRAVSQIDDIFATEDGRFLVTTHSDGAIISYPLKMELIHTRLNQRRFANPSPPAYSISTVFDHSESE